MTNVTKDTITISIHAPTRGATYADEIQVADKLFQSTLPRGERHMTPGAGRSSRKFQSTLPRGERPRPACWRGSPARFQSTLPRGERLAVYSTHKHTKAFQSTLPRGERHELEGWTFAASKFQSTLPRGERPTGRRLRDPVLHISIHAPTRGATWSLTTASSGL